MKKNVFFFLAVLLTIPSIAQINGYNAIIVGENVRLRSEPNLQCQIVGGLNSGLLVDIIDETNKRVSIGKSGNTCAEYGYKWYKVETSTNLTGWVFGKFIYEIIVFDGEDYENGWVDELVDESFTIAGKEFFYSYAMDVSYPPDDSLGLTGCDDLTFPVLYEDGKKVAYPIKYNGTDDGWAANLWSTADKGWLTLMSGEGGSDNITEITESNGKIIVKVDRGFQDGGAIVKLELTFKGSYFDAEQIFFEDQTPDY